MSSSFWWCHTSLAILLFLSPLDSQCSLLSLSSTLILIISPAAFSSLVPAKLRIQDGQWFQNGSVWPWEPNGGWYRGEFWHTKAQTRTHTSRNDCSYSGLIYTDWWFIMIADHHLRAHYTHSLDYAAPSVSMHVYTSVCAACNGNPFSSWIADTCRKSRLCKVKSGPFLHEIIPCWYVFVWYDACDTRFTVCNCVHVYMTWYSMYIIVKVSRPAQRCIRRWHEAQCKINYVVLFHCWGRRAKQGNKERVCVCLLACACARVSSPVVQMFPIFTSPLSWICELMQTISPHTNLCSLCSSTIVMNGVHLLS